MINIKKTTITLSLLLLLSCGFQPIYSKKEMEGSYNFYINEIKFTNKNITNQVVKNYLKNYLKEKENSNKLNLKINTSIVKTIASKNIQGNAETFLSEIIVYLEVYEKNSLKGKKKFKEKFEYKNQKNKFNLNKYEKNIHNNLITKISNDIILYLYSIK